MRFFEILEPRRPLAFQASMLSDLDGDPGINGNLGASLNRFTDVNGTLYFAAVDKTSLMSLWRVNGSGIAEKVENVMPGGTLSLALNDPLYPNVAFPTGMINANGTLYFDANDGVNGFELWKVNADGLAEIVEDAIPGGGIAPGASSSIVAVSSTNRGKEKASVNGTLYFVANDGVNGTELWRINATGRAELVEDGTPDGGIRSGSSGSIEGNKARLHNAGGTLYFLANDGTNGKELWKINQTGVAEMVEDSIPGGGLAPGSASLFTIYSNARYDFGNNGGTLYFQGDPSLESRRLWEVPASGIAQRVQSSVATGSIVPAALSLPVFLNGTGYFAANDSSNGIELWRTTSPGFAEIVDDGVGGLGIANGTASSNTKVLGAINSTLYFSANDGTNGDEIWRINGAGFAEMVEDSVAGGGINPGGDSSTASFVGTSSGTIYFNARTTANGYELWRVNSSGVAALVDSSTGGPGIRTGVNSASPSNGMDVDGTFYFSALGSSGRELWRINTAGFAEMVEDSIAGGGIGINSISSSPQLLINLASTLYFQANDGVNGPELWRVNASGMAEMIEDLMPGGGINSRSLGSDPQNLTDVNGTLYFAANDGINGVELWRAETSNAISPVQLPIYQGSTGSFPRSLTNVSGTLYFIATSSPFGTELWRIDQNGLPEVIGQTTGVDLFPGQQTSLPELLTNVNGTLYFQARQDSSGLKPWRINSSGNAEPIQTAITTADFITQPSEPSFIDVGGTTYFIARDLNYGEELWKVRTDGLAELVEDAVPGGGIAPGNSSSSPASLTNFNGTLYFAARNDNEGEELWFINATGKAELVEDSIPGGGIRPGPDSGYDYLSRRFMSNLNGTLYFRATDGVVSNDFWRINPQGIAEHVEFSPPAGASFPRYLTESNGSIYFQGGVPQSPLLRIDSSGIATPVLDVSLSPNAAFSNVSGFTDVAGTFYFTAQAGPTDRELWRVNALGLAEIVEDEVPGGGLSPGTSLGYNQRSLTNLNGTLFFEFRSPVSGNELWFVNGDGIAAMVDDSIAGDGINPGQGNADPRNLILSGGRAYFTADDGTNGTELWTIQELVPTDIQISSSNVLESANVGTTIGTFSSTDQTSNTTHTYELVPGIGDNDNASFSLSGNSLITAVPLDYESKNTYSIRVRTTNSSAGQFEKSMTISVVNVRESSISNRQVFYNRSTSSVFGNGSGNPINALDATKSALRPGQTSTTDNYTNYARGLNGLVVDIANLNSSPTDADFQFATWDGISPNGFVATSATATISVIPDGGGSGVDRIKIEFEDHAIRNTWLRVTVLANANTDLLVDDVFYFGNAVADMFTGNIGSPTTVRTNATDTSIVRQNQLNVPNSESISSIHDVNKDGRVNATDTSIVRQNQNPGSIRFFTAPLSFLAAEFGAGAELAVDAIMADSSWLDGHDPFSTKRRRPPSLSNR